MEKAIINLKAHRNADCEYQIEIVEVFKNAVGTTIEEPVNWSDCRFDLHIRPNRREVVKLSSETGDISITGNVLTIKIAHDKTHGATWHTADYDLQVTTADGKIKYPIGGIVELEHNITDTSDGG
ncbi:hypothetical protein DPW02_00305 [Aggregatibacter aphrophilus]|nr:hypothetical protein DPW02_00305 [Aggregatibacter aphrophilus]